MIGQKIKTAPPTGSNVFQRTGTNFELNQHIIKTNILTNFKLDQGIIGTNLLTKFHEDRTSNVPSSFELDRVIIWTKRLTKFHEDRTRMWPLDCLRTNFDGRTDDGQRPITKAHPSNLVS
ncbi:hypothetical protein DPMN_036913 [Dreissena polymorpha]|uniref:Uncharacterized protein n=1 Tax=Dreissena polymorpha TaxID=45954 RepID=A0A9D4RLW2_DREPO|nr:hypothetical protein DPMN_036913 [Dreissena polymorpha]